MLMSMSVLATLFGSTALSVGLCAGLAHLTLRMVPRRAR
jgi:hypothetical protein